MKVFQEKQQFRQWWLIAILAITIGGVFLNIYYETEGFSNIESNTASILTLIFTALIIASIFFLELRTKIDSKGITANFDPFPFFKRHYNWSEIDKIYVRKYSALTAYGDWGVRGFGKAKAYNVSGNYGIQIVTNENKSFLIGTQKPQDAERVLKRYAQKTIQ
ncbi:hypothetical protein [Gillisia sp. JM1]|uniref:hypothetical protein n=1 Tax=Gillisia sp. JM1 TaxID=1283286 RepID=UPI000419D399|nr:hypothetical protein [Gillisia sp. JM1]